MLLLSLLLLSTGMANQCAHMPDPRNSAATLQSLTKLFT